MKLKPGDVVGHYKYPEICGEVLDTKGHKCLVAVVLYTWRTIYVVGDFATKNLYKIGVL